ncbi:MAG: hypothetical protein KC478_09385 [Bacteriovoracaceae bacterium]|nr:hypothetical protein [Bacteriovoracaceae bacterium]
MNKIKFLLVASFMAPIVGANTSYVPLSETLYDGGTEASVLYKYWQSQTSIDSQGQEVPFEQGESYTQMDLEFNIKYGLTDNLQVGAGVLLRSNSSTAFVNGEELSSTTTGVKSGLIQLKYALPKQNKWRLALEANYISNFITNTTNDESGDSEIVLGDDGNSTSAGLSGTYFFESMNLISGRVHYRNPSSSLSSEIVSELEGVIVWSKVSLLAGVENVTSLNQDPYSNDPETKPSINSGNTLLYNSINRSWTAPYIGLNFVLNKYWRLETRAQSRINAVSSDLGTAFTVMLAKRKSESKALDQK